jgi:twitching motility protein PilT
MTADLTRTPGANETRTFGHVDEYLAIGQRAGASDIHLGVNSPAVWRLNGRLQPIWPEAAKLTADDTATLTDGFLSDLHKTQLNERGDVDFAYANGFGRFRTSVVRQRLGIDLVFRIINTQVRTMEELGLPESLKLLTRYQNGLILVTGSVGSGKSTTLAALVEQVNLERREHIITLEDPIEYIFEPKGCHITQREVPVDSASFPDALKAALREDADIVLVGEMRDLETISLALTAAETGLLVFGTLHTNNARKTIDRMVDAFPANKQAQVRTMLANSLRGVLAQLLLKKADGSGRLAVNEILIASPAVSAIIREGATQKLQDVIVAGRGQGMQFMDDAIHALLRQGLVSPHEAFMKAIDKNRFKEFLSSEEKGLGNAGVLRRTAQSVYRVISRKRDIDEPAKDASPR